MSTDRLISRTWRSSLLGTRRCVVRAGVCRVEDIIDHCARNLAPYKVPRQIEFCEALA